MSARPSRKILAIDIGGTHVKAMLSPHSERREFLSGPKLTAEAMVAQVVKLAADWTYDVVSAGYPGPAVHNRPLAEPHNLGKGWVGFDYKAAFTRPVKIINDAAMQALGSYEGGRGGSRSKSAVNSRTPSKLLLPTSMRTALSHLLRPSPPMSVKPGLPGWSAFGTIPRTATAST